MNEKTLSTLEFPKILERLAGYTSFSASGDLARAMRPTTDLDEARVWQAQVSEARFLLSVNADITVGGAHDVRPLADLAAHGGVLQPSELLDVKSTLISARTISRTFEKNKTQYPRLAEIAADLPTAPSVVDAITHAITEQAEVADYASPKLAVIRREVRVAHDRLMSKLQRMINDPKTVPLLQEPIITQRDGRYVIPLRADFKGRVRSVVHDQSASGATLFVEPLVIVELNNRWKELQLAERDEERRILTELSGLVGEFAPVIARAVEVLAKLDLAFARARFAEDMHGVEPVLKPFEHHKDSQHPGSTVLLYQARHPLLDPATVVPLDITLDAQTFAVIITGPNTGGKTVTLKTVGLLALMAQSGLHIPAQSGSELSIFKRIFADIGDEQSIEQSLSTFSGHIKNIIRILKLTDRHSLVLLDELGAGTDPQEGAALARAILLNLLERRVTTLVATHYPELKEFAHSTQGVVNASVEFNLHTLRPTYHLTIGLPGRSNALAIAERLGLPAEIIQSARTSIHPDDLRAEGLLDEIHRQRDLARKARGAADRAKFEAESQRADLAARLEKIEDERRTILEKAQLESEQKVQRLEAELEQVRKALTRARQPVEALAPLEDQVAEMQQTVQKPVERKRHSMQKTRGALRLGEKVRVRSLQAEGVVTALGEAEVEVQVGVLRVRARLPDIDRKVSEPEPPAEPSSKPQARPADAPVAAGPAIFHASPGIELDLRGQRADDALDALDRYIESAFMANLPFVRIIHGKGTGRLREAVRQAIRENAHVKSWETGGEKEGGEGVTVAKLHVE